MQEKANDFWGIRNAVNFTKPSNPDQPFYTDFSDVRGSFKDTVFYRSLTIDKDFAYKETHFENKKLIFFSGHRGSGKTTEMAKYAKNLNNSNGFLVINCNIDTGLDVDDIDFVDILIYLSELLTKKAEEINLDIDRDALQNINAWYSQTVQEVNENSKLSIDASVSMSTPLAILTGITAKLRTSLSGTKETKKAIRTVLTNKFKDFAFNFNSLVKQISAKLREEKKAKDILFIIDGLEKTASPNLRKKIILDESVRIQAIESNLVIILPYELMKEKSRLEQFSNIISFPVVKLSERDGTICEKAHARFNEFIKRRVNINLFDNGETIKKIIKFSGGSPRQLLKIIDSAFLHAEQNIIDDDSIEKGLKHLATKSQFLEKQEIEILKKLKQANKEGKQLTEYSIELQDMLEKLIIFEYNDGNDKRVNPIIEISPIYQQEVENQ